MYLRTMKDGSLIDSHKRFQCIFMLVSLLTLKSYQLIYRPIWTLLVAAPLLFKGRRVRHKQIQASFPGDHRDMVPPDPIPNSEVKRVIADGSVGFPHVRVGHRQD
jgi:hypothetical protein